jgi:hypothetical protein
MKQYQWMATAEKFGNVWKVGVQDETGAIYFSKKTFETKEIAQELANRIYKEEEYSISDFEYDCK